MQRHSSRLTERIACTCRTCGALFTILPSQFRQGKGGYCTPDCRMAGRTITPERFWASLDRSGECWLWTGKAHLRFGYGVLTYQKRHIPAHRFAWELTHGPIPAGMKVMHTVCDNPPCCRPGHLKLGTNRDNLKEMWQKGRGVLAKYRKLSDAEVRDIRALYAVGNTTMQRLAERFDVSDSQISSIVNNQSRMLA